MGTHSPLSFRFLATIGSAVVALASIPIAGQTPPSKSNNPIAGSPKTRSSSKALRTAWGDPDLQGQWSGQTSTPLERPQSGPLAGKNTLTDDEAEAFEESNRSSSDRAPTAGDPGTYNAFWRDPGKALKRTSLIIDPADGRIPPLTPEAQKRIAAERAERSTRGPNDSPDTYEDLSPWTRCISRGWNGIGSFYSSNYQIFQTREYVVLQQELIHESRIIPLDGRAHVSRRIALWMGDSRGHWEGDTLVVDTTNFDSRTNFRGSRETLHLIERFKRVDADTIEYEFTIDDPKTFTARWTAAWPWTRVTGAISLFEYACHEGNYAMRNILSGARAAEKPGTTRSPK